jgi:hypothetical protein
VPVVMFTKMSGFSARISPIRWIAASKSLANSPVPVNENETTHSLRFVVVAAVSRRVLCA